MCLQCVSMGTRLCDYLGIKNKQALQGHSKSSSPIPGASQTLALQPLSIAGSLIALHIPLLKEEVKPQNG